MNLIDLVDNKRTDKNTYHSYLDLYENLLNKYKYTSSNVLEIGIGTPQRVSGLNDNGGSIKLWHDYFPNAQIYAADIISLEDVANDLKNNSRINIILGNAYDPMGESYNTLNKINYDFVLDDGPHSLDSMIRFICLYFPLLNEGGILIIEDIQDTTWLDILKECVPDKYKNNVQFHDLRHIKNRYDDIVFVITK
jgi:hypothetical protein